ncbi:Dimethylaniline monooxygenase, N-oxide-forming [Corchorus olitorius]|uniref:Flavin-containing monooxygenase n=1 Tax=Corchorus olitorius TaxID=93759 RepID=A0A1R3KRJ6_9ROSI|nr:Dimethylaniline monooxygenase, N-oxide-forming [Corchorus olitorius]
METGKRIAIIGAGISGLLACKYALEKGFGPMVFEARSVIGGVWSQTLESTKLQTPKDFYQFSDFPWPPAVRHSFPDHKQVLEYLQAYAVHFNILPRIKFNTKVTCIDYVTSSTEDMLSWDLWGGTGQPFSPSGKWNIVTEKCDGNPSDSTQVYQVDFVIVCIGKHSDLPNIPDFPLNKGPQVFDGKVLHSMDYAAMDDDLAAELIKEKRVTVIGFQKSAVDLAAEVANTNGARHPCTLVFRTVHWTVPENLLQLVFRGLNRFTELMFHKPGEGFFHWLLAIFLSPLLWIFSTVIECYLKCIYPLKKYNMVPNHSFFKQISSCMFTILPANFYDRVKDGSLFLKKSQTFSFCKNGLMVEGESRPLLSDIVIFATGYRGDEKLKTIFKSTFFQKCIAESSVPFYRECIHPRIPQLAILGYADSPAILYSTEMRSKWITNFLSGNFKLPAISKMEEDVKEWEICKRNEVKERYRRSCVSPSLQIYCNDQLCKDMGCNSTRKNWFLAELFVAYGPKDYKSVS